MQYGHSGTKRELSSARGTTIKRRIAFTITELLVVISILLVLAGLLLPVFAKTKAAAWRVDCIGNLRNLGLAVSLYSEGYDGAFPSGMEDYLRSECWWTSEPSMLAKCQSSSTIEPLLIPYTKSARIFSCPADRGLKVVEFYDFEQRQLPNSFQSTGSSYWYNDALYLFSRTDSSLPSPAKTALYSDRSGAWHVGKPYALPTIVDRFASYRGFSYNSVFVDGHVQQLSPNRLNFAVGSAICDDCQFLIVEDLP